MFLLVPVFLRGARYILGLENAKMTERSNSKQGAVEDWKGEGRILPTPPVLFFFLANFSCRKH